MTTTPGQYFARFVGGGPVAFFHTAVHGARQREVPRFSPGAGINEFPRVDWVLEDNPDCTIPADAVPITDAQWQAWAVGLNAETTPA